MYKRLAALKKQPPSKFHSEAPVPNMKSRSQVGGHTQSHAKSHITRNTNTPLYPHNEVLARQSFLSRSLPSVVHQPKRAQTAGGAAGHTRRPSPSVSDPTQFALVQANTKLQQSLTQLYKSTSHQGREVAPPWDALDVEPRWRHRTNIYDANTPALTQVRLFSVATFRSARVARWLLLGVCAVHWDSRPGIGAGAVARENTRRGGHSWSQSVADVTVRDIHRTRACHGAWRWRCVTVAVANPSSAPTAGSSRHAAAAKRSSTAQKHAARWTQRTTSSTAMRS
jgi:hypothetical protein